MISGNTAFRTGNFWRKIRRLCITLLTICRRSPDWSVHFKVKLCRSMTLVNVLNYLQLLIGTLFTSRYLCVLHKFASESLKAHCLTIQISSLSIYITILLNLKLRLRVVVDGEVPVELLSQTEIRSHNPAKIYLTSVHALLQFGCEMVVGNFLDIEKT